MQIAESVGGRRRIVAHVGSAHTTAELGLLLEHARGLLEDSAQGQFDLGVEPTRRPVSLISLPGEPALFAVPESVHVAEDATPARVLGTGSGVLFDALAGVYAGLGFDAVGDQVFRDLVIARIVEPTSLRDAGRVLADLGQRPASEKTLRRTLLRCAAGKFRDRVAELCFAHAISAGDLSLVLYDVTTLYFEAEKEDALRKVGYSKERRIDPQIVVGLLVDRRGFPLEIGCFEGNKDPAGLFGQAVRVKSRRARWLDRVRSSGWPVQ